MVNCLQISVNPSGLIRCLAVSASGLWLAAGQSSGNITILDTRTGLVISNWRAHESEVLQLVALDNNTIISSSLDQTISVWNINDGKFMFNMRFVKFCLVNSTFMIFVIVFAFLGAQWNPYIV